jgi:prevent-host-death family protein
MNGNTGWWVGIDVAKSKLDVAVLDDRGKIKSHVFDNSAKGFAALIAWLRQRGCDQALTRVCMEATGPYSEAVATTLCDAGWFVSVVNPSRVKGFAQSEMVRNKTDKADAALLARFEQAMKPEAWIPPAQEVRELRALVDRLQALKEMQQQEANRLESALNQPAMQASIHSHMQWLRDNIKELERQIDDHIDRHPGMRVRSCLLPKNFQLDQSYLKTYAHQNPEFSMPTTTLTASEARANLYRLMDQAAESHQPVTIVGKRNDAVLVSAEDWQAIQETLTLLSVPGMRESIKEGMAEPVDGCATELDW